MTMHKTRTTDRGSGFAGSREHPKRKPQAFITRNEYGSYEIRDESGKLIGWALMAINAHKRAMKLGFSPIRNKHGDAAKTK